MISNRSTEHVNAIYSKMVSENVQAHLVYAQDRDIRTKASSGGFITSLQKFLLQKEWGSVICFRFNKEKKRFEPFIATSPAEYLPSSSIYHDVNLVSFVRENISLLKNKACITCLPCEVNVIRRILKRNNVEGILVALTCSAQLTVDATHHIWKQKNIAISNVRSFQYRGNGWPSGLQIKTNTDREIYIPNNQSLWRDTFHSGVFTLKKCFSCPSLIADGADFIVADPWIKEYVESDTVGTTVLLPMSKKARHYFKVLIDEQIIVDERTLPLDQFMEMQRRTIQRKIAFHLDKNLFRRLRRIIQKPIYKKLYPYFPKKHRLFYELLIRWRVKRHNLRPNLFMITEYDSKGNLK